MLVAATADDLRELHQLHQRQEQLRGRITSKLRSARRAYQSFAGDSPRARLRPPQGRSRFRGSAQETGSIRSRRLIEIDDLKVKLNLVKKNEEYWGDPESDPCQCQGRHREGSRARSWKAMVRIGEQVAAAGDRRAGIQNVLGSGGRVQVRAGVAGGRSEGSTRRSRGRHRRRRGDHSGGLPRTPRLAEPSSSTGPMRWRSSRTTPARAAFVLITARDDERTHQQRHSPASARSCGRVLYPGRGGHCQRTPLRPLRPRLSTLGHGRSGWLAGSVSRPLYNVYQLTRRTYHADSSIVKSVDHRFDVRSRNEAIPMAGNVLDFTDANWKSDVLSLKSP